MESKHLVTGYKVGEISQALLGRQKSKTNENKELNILFRSVGYIQPEFVLFTPKTSNKVSKKSQDDTPENSKIQRRDTIEETRKRFYHNRKRNLPTSDDEGEDVVQKKHKKASKKSRESEEDPGKLSRTVFVGNLPVAFTRKKLKRLFSRYGAVESVRFRSAGLAKPDLSRKVAMKTREFHPDRHNINGYVVFKEKEYAIQALQSNGLEVDGLHIRVDLAGRDQQHDHLRSVFVGNLPFDAEEEMLRQIFVDCGEVEAVRIIRDSKTGAGKGFGFILFKGKDAVMFALKMNKSEFNGRKLRVFPSSENPNSGQAREFKKGKPVAYTFSGLTSKRADRGGNKGRKKKPDFKHAQGRQQRKLPRNSTGSNKSTDIKRGGKSKDYNRGKHKTVRTRFLKGVQQGGENNRKRKQR